MPSTGTLQRTLRCYWTFLSLTLAVLLSALPAEALIKVMFLYSAPISDLAFTFNMNIARTAALDALATRYPADRFEMSYYEKFDSFSVSSRIALLNLFARSHDIVWSASTSNTIGINIADIAANYSSTTFVSWESAKVWRVPQPPNVLYFGTDIAPTWFLAGAVAGAQLMDGGDMCFFYPNSLGAYAVNAFYIGMNYSKTQARLLASKINTFYNEEKEATIARVFVQLGCRILVRYSDSRAADLYVASLANGTMSIGYASDSATYVGDSVLTSVWYDFKAFIVQVVESVYLKQPLPKSLILPFTDSPNSTLKIAALSSAASDYARQTLSTARHWIVENRDQLFCGRNVFLNGTQYTANRCVPLPIQITTAFQLEPGIVALSDFAAPSSCPAGNRYAYDLSNLALSCQPCPLDTYSTSAGSQECRPCPSDHTAPLGATGCTPRKAIPTWVWIIVAVGVALIGGSSAFVVSAYLKKDPAPVPAPVVVRQVAPQGPDVTLVIVAVDCKRCRKWRNHILSVCDVMSEVVTQASARCGVYIVSNVAETHLIAADSARQAYVFLVAVKQLAALRQWPTQVSLTCVLHEGRPDIVKTADQHRTRYIGPDLDLVREMFKHCGGAGGFWCSASTLARDPLHGATLGSERNIALPDGSQATAVELLSLELESGGTMDMRGNLIGMKPHDDEVSSQLESSSTSTSAGSPLRESDDFLADDEDLVVASLSILSKTEFRCAQEFTTEVLKLFLGGLPLKNAVAATTTVCNLFAVSPPSISPSLPDTERGMKLLRTFVPTLAVRLVKQLEELELVSLMERWSEAAQERESSPVRTSHPPARAKTPDRSTTPFSRSSSGHQLVPPVLSDDPIHHPQENVGVVDDHFENPLSVE
jgi:basic membrane lipoprotein Med (substrate-binding protein (PBP1-ABC) superfamily)